MHILDTIRDLHRHMEWADAAVWQRVLASEAARDDAKLRELLHHIHLVQRAFLQLWKGMRVEFREPGDFQALGELCRWGREHYMDLHPFLESFDEGRLDGHLKIPWAKRMSEELGMSPQAVTHGESMLQVAAHSTYHRGQVNARLRELGDDPPLVDYIAWLWFGRPQPDWPATG